MRYVRTKNSIREIIDDYGNCCSVKSNHKKTIDGFTIIYGLSFAPRADTIEELCDCYVIKDRDEHLPFVSKTDFDYSNNKDKNNFDVYGAIWVGVDLKSVAKMNEKGELELL